MSKQKRPYHHGHLAESLLDAVDEIANQFGLEAVTLRACAKRIGVSPASAFRHYTDKRDLMTAFATRAINQLADAMEAAKTQALANDKNAFFEVGMAYITFALDAPALFRAMWREETIYAQDERYLAAANRLAAYLKGGFAKTIDDEDPGSFSPQELLAWSSVHGLASLFVDGPVAAGQSRDEKRRRAREMLTALMPALMAK